MQIHYNTGSKTETEVIFLVMYENGPSDDPHTVFYKYADGKVFKAGSFDADIRYCEIREGMISGTIRRDIIQTDWIWVHWMETESGMLEEIPQEVYGFVSLNEIILLYHIQINHLLCRCVHSSFSLQ